jgi:serine phosphatase RsbU (regulator of sigma subunit)
MMPMTVTHQTAKQSMQCMEIWGGNRAVDSAVSVPGIDAWVFSQPYAEGTTGGDIHYVSMCAGGNISRFVVADVAGHGDAVGHLAASLRALMRRHINKLDQSRFARALNEEFSTSAEQGVFATAILATYFAPKDCLVVCNAGHPPPLWYRAAKRSWEWMEHDIPDRAESLWNLPLGIIAPTEYHQFAVPLAKDDLVLVFTDSLIEAENPDGEQLGREGLRKIVGGIETAPPGTFCRMLLEAIDLYRGNEPPKDDLTVLLLRHNAGNPPIPSVGEMVRVVGKLLHLVDV